MTFALRLKFIVITESFLSGKKNHRDFLDFDQRKRVTLILVIFL